MTSEKLKERLVSYFWYLPTKNADWKRIGKRTIKLYGEDCTLRTFKNEVVGKTVWTFGDDFDSCRPLEGEKLCYYFSTNYMDPEEGAEKLISFGVAGDDEIYDQHVVDQISAIFNFPEWVEFDELCENMSIMSFKEGKSVEDFTEFLSSVGIEFAGSLDEEDKKSED